MKVSSVLTGLRRGEWMKIESQNKSGKGRARRKRQRGI
jgi:predicted transcriptional regulator